MSSFTHLIFNIPYISGKHASLFLFNNILRPSFKLKYVLGNIYFVTCTTIKSCSWAYTYAIRLLSFFLISSDLETVKGAQTLQQELEYLFTSFDENYMIMITALL